jgi:uncharacterized protein
MGSHVLRPVSQIAAARVMPTAEPRFRKMHLFCETHWHPAKNLASSRSPWATFQAHGGACPAGTGAANEPVLRRRDNDMTPKADTDRSSVTRGFALMDPSKQREIASKGGKAAHAQGRAHQFTPVEARDAGRKGGEAVSRDRDHMAKIGRIGGLTRGRSRADGVTGAAAAESQVSAE